MAKRDNLHQLIHSLSINEKRYFRMFAGMQTSQKDRNYLRIFDALVKMKEYDGEDLSAQFQGEAIQKHLSSEKLYLYRQILRAMRVYRARGSRKAEVGGLISDAIFLYEKMMYQACQEQFSRAKKIAQEIEDLPQIYHILVWERKLAKRLPRKDPELRLQEIIAEKEAVLHKMREEAAFHDAYDSHFLAFQRAHKNAPPSLKENPPFSLPDTVPATFMSQHLLHEVRALEAQTQGLFPQMAEEYDRLIRHWEAHPAQIDEEPSVFQAILSNALAVHSHRGDHPRVEALLRRMQGLKPAHTHQQFSLQQSLYAHELILCLNTGQFERGCALAKKLVPWLQKRGEDLGPARRQSFWLNMALAFFFSGETRQASDCANRLLDEGKSALRVDIQRFLRLFLIMIQTELGNAELLDSLLRAARRYLKGKGEPSPFELCFLAGMRKVERSPLGDKEAWHKMHNELLRLQAETTAKPPVGLQEALFWVQSRSMGLPLKAVAQAHYQATQSGA